MESKKKAQLRRQRRKRVRAVIKGTRSRPRLSVFRSSSAIYTQLIDDQRGVTLISFNSRKLKTPAGSLPKEYPTKRLWEAFATGQELAKLAVKKKIKTVVFDRNGYAYHGRVKALAEGARQKGLKF